MKLTNAKLRSLPIGKKVSDGGGLYYQPTAPNKGKWSYRFAMDGKSHEMGLGTFPQPFAVGGRTFFHRPEIDKWLANKREQRGFQKAFVKLEVMNENIL